MKNEIAKLVSLLNSSDIHPDSDFEKNILLFSEIFLETAKTLNLTAIKTPHDVMIKHYYDSIYPIKFIADSAKIIDVGCGGGFPSIPLKLARPALEFTLLDSLKKRLTFLDGVISQLGLTGIETVHARAEDAGRQKNMRDKYDVAVSRAVASLDLLCEYCLPFVKKDGVFLAYKGAISDDELAAAKPVISSICASLEDVVTYTLPDNLGTRTLLIIRKTDSTPHAFPHSSSQLSKKRNK